MKQKFSSASTSINKAATPAIFKKITWSRGTKNLDWGGGKYDTASEYLKTCGVENFIYDPYNRTPEHNAQIGAAGTYDTATISNVLNVIAEPEIRKEIVKNCLTYIKEGGKIYIKIYEGDKSGIGKATKKDCWQNNTRLIEYSNELREFHPVTRNNIIIISKETN